MCPEVDERTPEPAEVTIRLICGQIQPVFHWNKMKFSSATVALALYFSFFRAMPAPAVVETLRDLYRVKVSHDTITRWSHKAAFLLDQKCRGLAKVPQITRPKATPPRRRNPVQTPRLQTMALARLTEPITR
jgi:hypothetical protein